MTHRTNPADDYASYLIRLWRETLEESDTPWQARLESIQTGQSWHFATPADLLTFLEQALPNPGRPGDDQPDPP